MAREELAIQTLSSSGIIPAWSTPTADGFKVSNDGDTHIHIKNANAGTVTVTFITPGTVDGLPLADKAVTIATNVEKEFVLPINPYNRPDNDTDPGYVYFDISPQSSVLVKATHK